MNNNRKLYLAGLGVAAAGLILDQVVFTDAGVGPAAAVASGEAPPRPVAPLVGSLDVKPTATGRVARALDAESKNGVPALWTVNDPFDPTRLFGREAPAVSAEPVAPQAPDQVTLFVRSHTLSSVVLSRRDPAESMAIVTSPAGARALRVGDTMGGFTLIKVEERSATFRSGTAETVLSLPGGDVSPTGDPNPPATWPG